jgi:Staphylococcal nuclease homologue
VRAVARVAYLLGALSRSDGRLSNTSNLQALRKRPSGSLFQPSPVKPIRQGMAWHYKEYQHEQTTHDRLVYRDEEKSAKARRVGLWKDAKPVPPWEFRRTR